MSGLPEGFTLREATAADHEAIEALCGDVFDAHEAAAVRHLLAEDGYGPGRWTVVTDVDGTVVSTCTLLLHRLRYGHTDVPAAQVEYVATSDRVRRQGLVRAQFDRHHQWAAEAGALVLLVTGIPYVYRRLGYGYAVEYAPEHRVAFPPARAGGWEVGAATADDLPAIERLHRRAQDRADLVLTWPDGAWSWLLRGATSWEEQVLVARRDGEVGGFARLQIRSDEGYAAVEGAADALDPARSLLAECADRADGLTLHGLERPGDPWGAVVRTAGTLDRARFNVVYARIPDPVAFLDHVRDELSARLSASAFAHESGELELSFYEAGLVLAYEHGRVTGVRRDPEPALDPLDDDRPGIAPDAVPALLLGRFGAEELERRQDDVGFAADRALMAVLFPKLRPDVSLPV